MLPVVESSSESVSGLSVSQRGARQELVELGRAAAQLGQVEAGCFADVRMVRHDTCDQSHNPFPLTLVIPRNSHNTREPVPVDKGKAQDNRKAMFLSTRMQTWQRADRLPRTTLASPMPPSRWPLLQPSAGGCNKNVPIATKKTRKVYDLDCPVMTWIVLLCLHMPYMERKTAISRPARCRLTPGRFRGYQSSPYESRAQTKSL
jgi:hypothetical protein